MPPSGSVLAVTVFILSPGLSELTGEGLVWDTVRGGVVTDCTGPFRATLFSYGHQPPIFI